LKIRTPDKKSIFATLLLQQIRINKNVLNVYNFFENLEKKVLGENKKVRKFVASSKAMWALKILS